MDACEIANFLAKELFMHQVQKKDPFYDQHNLTVFQKFLAQSAIFTRSNLVQRTFVLFLSARRRQLGGFFVLFAFY